MSNLVARNPTDTCSDINLVNQAVVVSWALAQVHEHCRAPKSGSYSPPTSVIQTSTPGLDQSDLTAFEKA